MQATTPITNRKCDHAPCNCMVPLGQRFCSDYCEDHSRRGVTEIGVAGPPQGCGCGHADCAQPSLAAGG